MKFTIRNTLGPLFLILSCPVFVMLMWYTNTQLSGSLSALWDLILEQGFLPTVMSIWKPYFLAQRLRGKLFWRLRYLNSP